MNVLGAIRQLQLERDRLTAVIAELEALADSGDGGAPTRHSTRGRKFMGEAERREVSARMKRYWARRRRAPGVGSELILQAGGADATHPRTQTLTSTIKPRQ